MPLLRLNELGGALAQSGGQALRQEHLARACWGPGPIVIMLHGFKYAPDHPRHCPHKSLFTTAPRPPAWPAALGFGHNDPREGLAVAFGWQARGTLGSVLRRALWAGQSLAHLIQKISSTAPHRPVHLVAHSMGAEVIFAALPHLNAGSVHRVLLLTGATHLNRAEAALQTPAGASAEIFNIVSRENDVFDFFYEHALSPLGRAGPVIGAGIDAPNVANIQIDCPQTLGQLRKIAPIARAERRVCHWSSYTRPGVMGFYNRLLRTPNELPLRALKAVLPDHPAPRWSRILPRPMWPKLLPFGAKASS